MVGKIMVKEKAAKIDETIYFVKLAGNAAR